MSATLFTGDQYLCGEYTMLLSQGGVRPVNVFANQLPSMNMMWLVSTDRILSVISSYNVRNNVPPGKFQLGSLIKSYPAIVVSVA